MLSGSTVNIIGIQHCVCNLVWLLIRILLIMLGRVVDIFDMDSFRGVFSYSQTRFNNITFFSHSFTIKTVQKVALNELLYLIIVILGGRFVLCLKHFKHK